MIPNNDTTTYSAEYDESTDEWIVAIGEYEQTFDTSAQAYHWLAAQILADGE
jgi:hypothetical protein